MQCLPVLVQYLPTAFDKLLALENVPLAYVKTTFIFALQSILLSGKLNLLVLFFCLLC